MADGLITIDIDVPIDQLQSDAQTINKILNGIGSQSGNELDKSFSENAEKVQQKAEETKNKVDETFSKETKAKLTAEDDTKSGTESAKKNVESLPSEHKTDITAQDNTKQASESAQEGMKKIPEKHNTDLGAEDHTKPATDSAKKNADSTAGRFEHLKSVIQGTFLGNLAWNAASAGFQMVKNAVGGLITTGTQYNRLQQDMNAQWQTLTGSASKGRELVKETNDLATAAQNSTEMVNDLNQKFYAVTDSASKTRDLSKAVLTLQDAFGQSDDAVKNFAMQWSQMIGNGKANAQDMMSIQNVFPKFMGELVEYERKVTHNSSLTTAQVRDMMSQGKISAEAMNTVLIGMGQKYKNATDNFGNTMDGMERTIKARIPVLAGMIVKPFQDLKNPLLGKMSKWITSSGAEKAFENFGKSIAGIMNGLMTTIASFGTAFKANMGGLFANANVGSLAKSFETLGKAIQPVLQAIGSLAGIIAGNAFSMFSNFINGYIDGLTKIEKKKSALDFSGLTSAIQKLGQAWNSLTPYINKANAVVGEFIGMFARGAWEAAIELVSDLSNVMKSIGDALSKAFPQMNDTSNAVSGLAKHRGAIEGLGKATALLVASIMAGKGTWAVLDGMRKGFNALKNIPAMLNGITKAFPLVGKAIDGVKKSFDLLKLAFAANPFMATIAVIAALGLAFYEAYKHCKPFRDFVNGLGSWLKKAFDGAVKNVQAFNKAFVKGFKSIIDWVKKNWAGLALLLVNPIAGGLKLLYDNNPKFKKWVNDLSKNISKGLDSLKNNVSKGWDSIKKSTVKFFNDLPSNVSNGWNSFLDASHNFFKGLWTSMGDWGKKIGKNWNSFTKSFNDNRYVKAFKKGNFLGTVLGDMNSAIQKKGKDISKKWDSLMKGLDQNKWVKSLKKGTLFNDLFKAGQKHLNDFGKKWDSGWKSYQKSCSKSFKDMQKTTNTWGKNTDKWWNGFKKSFGKSWNSGWNATKNYLSSSWDSMKKNTNKFGENMQNWLDDFGPNFKKGWENLSKGVSDIFDHMWDGIKKLGKDAMGGLIDIVNGGISGINTVIYAFGGGNNTIKPIPKKFASGTGAFSGGRNPITEPTLAMVNDGFDSPETGNKEAWYMPSTGAFGLFEGRNSIVPVPAGMEIFSASETAQLMNMAGVQHFDKGTGFLQSIGNGVGSFFGGIGSWIKEKTDDLKKFFNLAKEIISNPIKYVSKIFNFSGFNSGKRAMRSLANGLFDQANKNVKSFWSTLWGMVSNVFSSGGANSDLLAAAQKAGAGKPYVWGAEGPDAFDCSGLVKYAIEHAFGKSFPHYSGSQYNATTAVSTPEPGDLVFFGRGGANHVGIYAGGDNYYSAQSPNASPNIGMGKISAVNEGPVSFRRIPGVTPKKSGDSVKTDGALQKLIKKTIAPGFWKFIDKLNGLFNISIGGGGPNSAPTGDHKHWLKQAGIDESWFNGLNSIIQQESGWQVNATNPSSGAYGIPQALPGSKMASAGSDWRTNPITQLKWMKSYILGRYGSLQNALSFRAANGWYGNGGEFDKPTVIGVGEDGKEFVINPRKGTADNLIAKVIAERATNAPESSTARLAQIFNEIKYSSASGYGFKATNGKSSSSDTLSQFNNNGNLDGNIQVNLIVDGKTFAKASYPTIKALQAHDITIKQAGGAIPVV